MEVFGTEAVFDLTNIMAQLLTGFLTKGLGSFIAFTYNLVTVTFEMYKQAFTAQVTAAAYPVLNALLRLDSCHHFQKGSVSTTYDCINLCQLRMTVLICVNYV